MAKPKQKKQKRQPFGVSDIDVDKPQVGNRSLAHDGESGAFAFFRDFGVRETIESIVVAIMLAMMFRCFEAEAFIIPTGSMAPSLQGQHMDLECEHCKYRYRTGASLAGSSYNYRDRVTSTFCPICQFQTAMQPERVPDHKSNNGDRILVNKFVYDAQDPKRYDVIVFKNPTNGKQNYIKRLVGMPGDNLLIENGDIYTMDPVEGQDSSWTKSITRKPADALLSVMQVVDDTDFIGPQLQSVDWPLRWQTWGADATADPQWSEGRPTYLLEGDGQVQMLRYRHLIPEKDEWNVISLGELPRRMQPDNLPYGRLIGDYYAYNDRTYRVRGNEFSPGLHWVGDLGFEADVEVESSSGSLVLDLVEGGAHFRCEIDIASGKATLSCDDSDVQFVDVNGKVMMTPSAQTSLRGGGSHHLRYVNADDRLNLWVDDELIVFDAADYLRDEVPIPSWSEDDAGDAEPLGIGVDGGKVKVTRLVVLRDVYYTSVKDYSRSGLLANETATRDVSTVQTLMARPELWSDPKAISFFNRKKGQNRPMFLLDDSDNDADDHFLPCGDNSPNSLDGRVWDGPKFVTRDMLIGRAMFIYWPHMRNRLMFPNFENMKFIK